MLIKKLLEIEEQAVQLSRKAENIELAKEFIPILEDLSKLRRGYIECLKISNCEGYSTGEILRQVRDYVQDRMDIMEVKNFLDPYRS